MRTNLKRIAELSEKHPNRKMQTIMHAVNSDSLAEKHKQLKGNKADGVDKVTKAAYAENLTENVKNLLKRMKSYEYKPQPARRTYIPKNGTEKLRPLA